MSEQEVTESQQDINQATTQDSTTAPILTPITSNQRISALDILRGFALIGILFMNIEWFSRPIAEISSFNNELTGLDHAVGWLIRCFVEGKFYKLFALLFGMGFAVMLTQAMRKDRPFGAWFTRRMLVLFAFGLAHMFFLWQGDILHDYAAAGLILLGIIYLLRKKRFEKFNNPNSILKIAIWWLCIPMLLASFAGIGLGVFVDRQSAVENYKESQEINNLVMQLEADAEQNKSLLSETLEVVQETTELVIEEATNSELEPSLSTVSEGEQIVTEEADTEEQTPQQQAQEIFEFRQDASKRSIKEVKALQEGNYWEATEFRIAASLIFLAFTPFFALTMLVPIFLLGYWLVVTGVIKNHTQHPKLFGNMARIGFGLGLFVTVGGLTIMGHPAAERVMPFQAVGNLLFTLGQFFMAAGYLGIVVRLLDSERWHKILAKLAPMGRMALTNYIMHSVILTSIFYGYAGGLYGEISRAPQMLIVLAIVVVQIVLSGLWLKHFQYGPLEWVWRSLTYKKRQPFKVITE